MSSIGDFFTPLERSLFGPLSANGCLLFDVLAKIGFVMMVVTALLTVLLVLLGSKMEMVGSFTMTLLLYFVTYLVNRLLHGMCMRTLPPKTLPSHQEGMIDCPPPSQDSTDFSTADISRLHGVLGNLGKEDQVLAKAQQTAPDPATVTLMPTEAPKTPNPTPTSTKTAASSLLPTGFVSGASNLADAFPHLTATLGPTTSAPTPTKTAAAAAAAAAATPAPTTAVPTTTPPVQPTYTSSPATHCTFHAVANTNLEAAFSSLQVYDISGANLNIQREINKRNLYIQRLQPGTSDQVRTFNTDLVNKLTAITRDLQTATPHVGDNMATLCQLPLTPP